MMASTKITADPGVPFIEIEREFDAPRDLVYRAWTEPGLLVQWLGPRDYRMEIDAYELRDGGRYRYHHVADDGSTYTFHGVFHGTPSLDGLTQTFEFEGAAGHVSLETISFEERDGRTMTRSHSVYQSVADRDAMIESGMETGVLDGFARLDDLLPSLRAVVA